jgi:hypothetical protein
MNHQLWHKIEQELAKNHWKSLFLLIINSTLFDTLSITSAATFDFQGL